MGEGYTALPHMQGREMGFFNSDAAAAAPPTVVLMHSALDYLADPSHDMLAARPQSALRGIAEATGRA
jgi:hypothetical protein